MGMWRTVALWMAWWAVLGGATAHAAGTDAYGYRSIGSAESGGPVVDTFVGISATGTRVQFVSPANVLMLNADDGVAIDQPLTSLNGGAGFPFYGTFRPTAQMSTNGFLGFTFSTAVATLTNQCPLPSTNMPDEGIAVVWDDLVMTNPPEATRGGYRQAFTTCPYAQGGGDACVVFEWYRARHFGSAIDQAFTFQAVLYASGNILLVFRDDNPEMGSSSTTGIDGPGGLVGVTQACDTAATIPTNSAVLILAPADGLVGTGEVEPNDDQASATALAADRCGAGILPTADTTDVWRIAGTTAGDRLFAYADTLYGPFDQQDAALDVVVGAGDTTIASDGNSGPGSSPAVAGVPLTLGGDVFLRVRQQTPGTAVGPYEVMTYVAHPDEVGTEVEPNDNILEARPVTAPVMAGALDVGEIDHYLVDAVEGDVVTVIVDNDPDANDQNTRSEISIYGPNLVDQIGYGDSGSDKPASAAGRALVVASGKQLVRVRRYASQGDSSYQMAVLVNCAPACADGDGDGVCDALDNCTGLANGDQADADADGLGDACEACPTDAAKTDPGVCGCGIADVDANGNGVTDCLANAELRARLDLLRTAVGALTKSRKKKPNPTADTVRALLDDVVAYLRSGPSGLVLAGTDAVAMADDLSSVVGKALKGAAKFKGKKKKAAASVQAAYDAVGS